MLYRRIENMRFKGREIILWIAKCNIREIKGRGAV